MAKRTDDYWHFYLTDEQVDTLRLILTATSKDMNSYNKNWLPSRIAAARVESLIDEINSVTG
jgi:hypothetical protein